MNSRTIAILILGLALIVLILGGVSIWYGDETPLTPPPMLQLTDTNTPQTSAPSPNTTLPPDPDPPVPQPPLAEPPVPEPVPPEPVPAVTSPDWEEQVTDLMTSDMDDTQASRKLLALMSTLPGSNQVVAAEYLVGLLPDEGYAAVIPTLTNALTAPDVLDVLMVDLLDRPDTTQLPLLLGILRIPNHPRREEASEYLEMYLGDHFGNDWPAWEKAMEDFLKENPE